MGLCSLRLGLTGGRVPHAGRPGLTPFSADAALSILGFYAFDASVRLRIALGRQREQGWQQEKGWQQKRRREEHGEEREHGRVSGSTGG